MWSFIFVEWFHLKLNGWLFSFYFLQTLYTYPDNFRAFKALIAAEYSGAKVKTADFEFGKTNKSPDFLKKFPLGKVCKNEISSFSLDISIYNPVWYIQI